MDPHKEQQGGQKQNEERRRDQGGQQRPGDKPMERQPQQPGTYPGDKGRQGKQ